jgi:hypothetical protein
MNNVYLWQMCLPSQRIGPFTFTASWDGIGLLGEQVVCLLQAVASESCKNVYRGLAINKESNWRQLRFVLIWWGRAVVCVFFFFQIVIIGSLSWLKQVRNIYSSSGFFFSFWDSILLCWLGWLQTPGSSNPTSASWVVGTIIVYATLGEWILNRFSRKRICKPLTCRSCFSPCCGALAAPCIW